MKKRLAALAPYLIILGIDFYLLPLGMRDTGSAMLLLLAAMPLAAFLAAVACGRRSGFQLSLSAAAGLLFLPSVPLYYNASAWVYAPAYAIVVLLGTALGGAFHKKR